MTGRDCANCGRESSFYLHGSSLSIPVCRRCARFYVMGITAGTIVSEDKIDVGRSVDVSIMKMVDDGIIPAKSVTRMGVRE